MPWSTNSPPSEAHLDHVSATLVAYVRTIFTTHTVVYDIKCILDETLDALENLTDAVINAIKPLLVSLIGDASKTACNSGIAIAGICILI